MKHNRLLDFVLVLVSLDVLSAALHLGLWMLFGPGNDDDTLATLNAIVSAFSVWTKLGLAFLLFKKVPFRINDSLAFRKVWVLSFFWPLVAMK